jgi:lauroyl/myristoyl acyltransferase
VLKRTGDRDADVRDGMRRWAAVLERSIARAPDQWSVFEPVWPAPGEAQTEGRAPIAE